MKALMKSKIKLLFSLIILFAALTGFVFTSCENSIQNNQTAEETSQGNSNGENATAENPESGLIKIVIDNLQNSQNNVRTVLPDIATANIVSLSLSGTQGSNTKNLGSWTSVSAMISDTIELRTGEWSLTLTALLNNGVTFTATTPANITGSGTQTVNFSLSTTATQGGVSLKVTYTGTAQAASYQLYTWSNGVQGATVLSQGNLTLNTTAHEVLFQRPATGSTALAEGNYRLIINFWGDAVDSVFLNSYSEIIRIKGGFTSYADDREIELNSMYTITYMNGGSTPTTLAGNPASSLVEKYSARSTAITLPDMVREGYVFDGWFANSTCTGTPLSTFEITSSTTLEPKTFYAKYRKICALSYIISASEDAEINLADLTAAQKTTYGIPDLPATHTEGETTDLPVLSFTDGVSASSPELFDGYHYTSITSSTGPALTGTGASQKYVIGASDLSDNTTIYIKVNPINSYVDPNAESDTVLAFNVSTPAKSVSVAKGWLKGAASTNNPKLYVKRAINTAADVEALSSLTSTAYGNAIVMRHSSLTAGNVVNFVSGTASLQNVTIDGGANWGTNHAADYVNESSNTGITATAGILSVGRYATLNMTNVTLQNNDNSDSTGKTILIVGSASMNSCTVTDCKATEGGGICVTKNLSIEDSTISYNYGTSHGGGLKAQTVTPLSVKRTTFIGNKSADGGAIYNEGNLILEDCTFTSNIVTGNGRNIYHLGDLQLKGEITFNDKTTNDIYYDNSETDTNPITFSSFTATGTGLPQTITPANYYSGPESAKVYNRQVFDFSEFSTNTTLINTILGYFELEDDAYQINTSGIISQTPGYITITPGFPDSYVCKWIQTISGGTRQINIIIQDRDGGSVSPATGSLNIGVYEGPDKVMDSTTTSFNYPSWLDPPSGTPFYVTFNVQVDDNTAYSYDYWPERCYIGSKTPDEEKAVGDIVFNDGSAMAYTDFDAITDTSVINEKKAAAIALIFYKGSELNDGSDTTTVRTLGVGLKHSSSTLSWCTTSAHAYGENITTIVTTNGDRDGSNNLTQIATYIHDILGEEDDTGDAAKYPAFHFAKNYKNVAGSNVLGSAYEDDWFLPSSLEFKKMYDNCKRDGSLFDIDEASDKLGGDKFEENWFASSSLVSNNGIFMSEYRLSDNTPYGTWQYNEANVCAIREF